MAFYNEFPHTRNYDDDLRELIDRYNTLNKDYETLIQIYEQVKQNIKDITIEQLQQWLDDGTLANIINDTLFNELNTKVDSLYNVFITLDRFPKQTSDTSDAERFQRAIDYLHSIGGGMLYVASGTYEIAATLLLYENIGIAGMNANGTILHIPVNITAFKLSDASSRKDNIVLKELYIVRESVDTNTVLIDFDHVSYSLIENVSLIQNDATGANTGCNGIHYGAYSYYNVAINLQVRQFNNGIVLDNEANGNRFFAGSCISCINYGVYINNSNSNCFFGHSIELVAQYAYYIENDAQKNYFYGVRIESTVNCFYISNDSFSNMVFGLLDFSTNGSSATNSFIFTATYFNNLENLGILAFVKEYVASTTAISPNTKTDLPVTTSVDRLDSLQSDGSILCKKGVYTAFFSFQFNADVNTCKIHVYRDGSEICYIPLSGSDKRQFTGSYTNYYNAGVKLSFKIEIDTSASINSNSNSSFYTFTENMPLS